MCLIIIPCWLICLMHGMRWKKEEIRRRSFQFRNMNMFEFFVVNSLTKNRWKSICLILHDLCNEYIIYSIRPLSLVLFIYKCNFSMLCGHVEAADLQTYLMIKTHINWIPSARFQLSTSLYTNSMYLKVRSCYNK